MEKSQAVAVETLGKRDLVLSVAIIGVLFFIFGFISWMNSILIPYFKIACELNSFQAYLVAFAFYIAYFVMSMPAAHLLERVGFKRGMMVGFWAMALGAFIFIPAAYSRTYGIFLAGLFMLGVGLAILQTAANPYITLLGPKESAAQRISLMGICNKAAGILSPLVFAAVVLKPTDSALFEQLGAMSESEKNAALDELVRRVIGPYAFLGIFLLILGYFVYRSPLPEIDTDSDSVVSETEKAAKTSVWQFPHLVLGAVAIFLHVGTQVIAIDTVIGYAGSMGIGLLEAKVFPSYTLFCTICGYLLGIVLIPKFVSQVNALRFCTLLGMALSLLIVFVKGNVTLLGHDADISVWFVVLLGLANSLVWAGIWPLALDGLGKFTKVGASILIMGLSGNAILPVLYGVFVDALSDRLAYLVLVPCYAYLVFFAFTGHKWRNWKFA